MTALALPPAAPPTRRNLALVGTIFATAAGTMLMGGLLAAYFGARAAATGVGNEWVDPTSIPNVALAVTYTTLVLSAFTAQWTVSAIKAGDRRQGYLALGVTLMLGAVAGDSAFADHMYAVTVGHLLLTVAAIVLLVVMGFRVVGGQYGPRNTEFVASAAAFWHFVVVAGVVVWWCIWFLEGGPG